MPKTILVAEDDVMVRNILVKTLCGANYSVLEADNAIEALQLSRGFDGIIHLLVADESLKTMRARDLFEQLRQSRPDLKVLQISGYPFTVLDNWQALIPGAAFLQKPFFPKRLVEKVSQILEPLEKAQASASGMSNGST